MIKRRRRCGRWPVAAVGLLVVAALLAGCGSSSLSGGQIRSRATRICAAAQARTAKIATPTQPSEGVGFLNSGVAALVPEMVALQRLHPPSSVAGSYRQALAALSDEIKALRSTIRGLHAGNDPIVAIKTLQSELAPIEKRATSAWNAVGLPRCAGG